MDYHLLIDGKLVPGARHRNVINPATERVFTASPCASPDQLDQAVAAADAAFPGWAATPVDDRAAALVRIADAIDSDRDAIAEILTREQGKPLSAATFEIEKTASNFRYFASLRLANRVASDGMGRRIAYRRRPLGVVAAIVPWNFPLILMANKIPAALLAGNTVVLKPAPTTPLATLRFAARVKDLLPPGVLNVIADDGDLGAPLSAHPLVRKVSFTGSTQTGRRVMANAADTLKRITLELGGNDPAIVLDDADLHKTADGLYAGAFRNTGQICAAVKRVYVPDSLYDSLSEALAMRADAAVVGDGMHPDTDLGPLQNRMQYERVLALLDETREQGTMLAGNGILPNRGYFVRPTIVRDIEDGTRLVDEEQFGPILPLIRYADVEDAIRRANASPYGLGASVWSSDPTRAQAVAERLEAGVVWINRHADMAPHVPFAGTKQSGFGVEMAEEGLAEFSQLQVISASEDAAHAG